MEDNPSSPAFFPLASLIWAQGDAPRAEKLLRAGVALHPAYAAPRVLLGEVLLAMDQPQEAAKELAAGVGRCPWNLQGQRLLADCLKRAGDEAGAKKALRCAAMFNPSDPQSRALLEEAPLPAAAPAARREAPVSPGGEGAPAPVPTPSLARLYMSQGHHGQAAEVFRQLLQREPGNTEWRLQLQELEARLGRKPAPPRAPAKDDFAEGLGEAFGEEAAVPAKAGAPLAGGADLDALLGEAEAAEGALRDDLASLVDAETTGAPAAPAKGAASVEDMELESLLGLEEEAPAAAARAPSPAAGEETLAGQAPAGGEDLDALFAEAEGGGDEAATPWAAAVPGEAPGAGLGSDLDAFFAEEEGEVPTAAAKEPAPAAPSDEELALDTLFEGQEENAAGAAAPPSAAAPGEALEDGLESLLAEDEEREAAVAASQPRIPLEPSSDEALDLDALFAEEGGEASSAPLRAEAPAAGAGEEEIDLGALLEAQEEGAVPGAPPAAEPAEAGQAGEGPEALLEADLEELFAEEAEAPPPAAAGAVAEDGAGDWELEIEGEDLGVLPQGMDAGGADEAEGLALAPALQAWSSSGAEVDPFLRNLIGLYLEEGNPAQALDLCRKAAAINPAPAWLAERIEEIESRLAGAGARLREFSKGDKEGGARPLSPAEVVERLEGWLQTLQRRKVKASAGP
ncbi:MAG: tetratricopeptide repeat protein [Nitrospinota bacterium]